MESGLKMNDFTKEELLGLMASLNSLLRCGLSRRLFYVTLQDKIQSMIDNYCEHDPHGDFHECVDRCRKCGVIVE